MSKTKTVTVSKWYHGGLAAAGASCFTHPLDLLKVQMQTQKGKGVSLLQVTGFVIKNQGFLGLYNGISASLLRQLTYSTVRFAIYESGRAKLTPANAVDIPFFSSVLLAAVGGFAGGFVGTPADVVNVRMQNDIKLPPAQRRNYKNVVHGIMRVVATEGVTRLWAGGPMNCVRAALMTIGQVSFYELAKPMLLSTGYFGDNVMTHITASIIAGGVATTLTQPVDVLKTRMMSSKPGEVKNYISLIKNTAMEGPLAFFKGFVPAFVRLAPHTIFTFVFLEQLKYYFGDTKEIKVK